MSIEAVAWALNTPLVTDPASKLVLIGLANHASADGTCAFPSIGTLAKYGAISERTVQRHLRSLEAHGLIKRGNQAIAAAHIPHADRRPVVYDLIMRQPEITDRGDNLTPRSNGETAHQNHDGVTLTTERGDTVTPEPSSNHPEDLEDLISLALESGGLNNSRVCVTPVDKPNPRARTREEQPSGQSTPRQRPPRSSTRRHRIPEPHAP